MGLIDGILAKMGYTKAKPYTPPAWLAATAGAERFNLPDGATYEAQSGYMHKLSWIYTAVLRVAELAATAKISVKRREGDELKDIANHPLEVVLDRPNPLQSSHEFLVAHYAYRKLNGNSYWWLNRTSENAPPSEIWLIQPHRIQPIPDENLFIRGYAYDPGSGQKIILEPWEVIHFKNFHPTNPFIGMSAIESLAVSAQGDIEAQKWNTKFFGKSNARLPGILAFKDMVVDTDWARIKADVKDASEKREMLMLRGAGDAVNWMQNAVSQREMEFIGGRTFTREEIFSVLAPGLSSILSVNATEANAKTGKATLIEMEVWPLLVSTADKLTNNLLPVYGDNLIAEPDDIRVTDRVLALSEIQEYSKTHTIEEIRKIKYGDDPLGDERDKLLPIQIVAASGKPESEEDPIAPQLPEETENEALQSDNEIDSEMQAWKKYELKRVGKKHRPFKAEHIPPLEYERIYGLLEKAETEEDIIAAFTLPTAADLAAELRRANDLLEIMSADLAD